MDTSYKVKLLKKQTVAENTMAFYLERPPGFDFIAGQNVDVGLIDHEIADPNDSARAFSIASAPHENHLLIVARMRDNQYKNALKDLPEGELLDIYGPYGSFKLHKDASIPAVFIIGGIGITPCYSILCDAVFQRSDRPLYLFYSNRQLKDAAYLKELLDMQNELANFKFIPTLTSPMSNSNGWQYEKGYINFGMISRYVSDPASAKYYIVGPSRMVWPMVQHLDGKVPRINMLVEDFTGF